MRRGEGAVTTPSRLELPVSSTGEPRDCRGTEQPQHQMQTPMTTSRTRYVPDSLLTKDADLAGAMCVWCNGLLQVAETVMDRAADISRFFPQALDVGCGRGHIAKAATGDVVGTLYQTDMANSALVRSACDQV